LDLGIDGKVALVMGASKGIGRAVASSLAREGARVAIASRSSERIEQAASEIAAEQRAQVRGFAADVVDVEVLPGLVGAVEQAFGSVEILVTNAGGPPIGNALSFTPEQWEAAYRSLVLAPIALIGAVAPGMRERRWGRIVNITSSTTRQPIAGFILSNSHRLAAVGAFKTLAEELGRDGVLVNSVAPGRIATDRIAELADKPLAELVREPQPDIPVGRLGTVEEMADVVAFVCSKRASYVNGVNLLVDGGSSRAI
jgi:3-oxoacyl-[acyl-carrier protein] reductase